MPRIYFLFIVLFGMASCKSPIGIAPEIAGADSVAINFFAGDGTQDTVHQVFILKDPALITELSNYVEAGSTSETCSFDGNLNIFKMNQVTQKIDFSYHDDDCMQFSFMYNNALYRTKLSKAAKSLLLQLKQ